MVDDRVKRIVELIEPLRVKPGSKVTLSKDFDPGYKASFVRKSDGVELLQVGVSLLEEYQDRLAAQDNWGVLMCLQALDAGGKDGTIRHVMSGVNPQGVHVSSFKIPSTEELDHDFLWRYAQRLPARSDIGIFNRSHYEEVLVVRVHPEILDRQKLPAAAKGKDIWARRYRETCRTRTGNCRRTTPRNGLSGTTTRRPSPRCCPTPAPNGRLGTSSRPTGNGSPGSACPRSWRTP
jgi:polyphosphate kinase 2 (PPK2 family)